MERYSDLKLSEASFPTYTCGVVSVFGVVDAVRVSSLGHLFLDFSPLTLDLTYLVEVGEVP